MIATPDALVDGAAAARALRLPDGFADPELTKIGLHDHVMPVGPRKYLEYVGPVAGDSYINRWLRRAGSGGYCLSVQVPDVPAGKARAVAAGVRLAADQELMGHPLFQMHPGDIGILLELDGITDPGVWFWDDVTPGPAPGALIDDIVAVEVGVPEPVAVAALWAEIIGLEPLGPTALDFSGCRVDFVEHAVGQLLSAQFRWTGSGPVIESLSGLNVRSASRA